MQSEEKNVLAKVKIMCYIRVKLTIYASDNGTIQT